MSECPVGLVECKYPKSCFKICNSCIKQKIKDELDYMILEVKRKAYNQALEDFYSECERVSNYGAFGISAMKELKDIVVKLIK